MPSTRRTVLAGTFAVASGCVGLRSGSPDVPAFARWSRQLPHDEVELLSVGGGPETPSLFVGSAADGGSSDTSHALHALSLEDGREKWRATVPNPIQTAPTSASSQRAPRLVFATGREGLHGEASEIRALDDAGERVWGFDGEDGGFLYPIGTTEASVFVGRRDDQLGEDGEYVYALDATDGAERWQAETGDVLRAGTAPRHDAVVVQTFGDRVWALDIADGDDRWQEHAESVGYDDGADRVFVEARDTVRALAVADGSERWRRELGGSVSVVPTPGTATEEHATDASEIVLVGDFDGRLLALDPSDGATRWTLSFDTDQFTPRVQRTGERLFVTGAGVHAVDSGSGERQWSFAPDTEGHLEVSAPSTGSASSTVFASTDRRLWALDPATGEKRWEFAPGSDAAPSTGDATATDNSAPTGDSAPASEFSGVAAAGDLALVAVGGTVYALDGSEPA